MNLCLPGALPDRTEHRANRSLENTKNIQSNRRKMFQYWI